MFRMLIFQLVVLFVGALEPSGGRVWLKTEMLGTDVWRL